LERALTLHRTIADRRNESDTTRALAAVVCDLGDVGAALGLAGEALRLARETEDLRFEVTALNTLGNVHAIRGDRRRAEQCHREALQLVRDVHDRYLEAKTLLDWAETNVRLRSLEPVPALVYAARVIIADIGAGLLERQAEAILGVLEPAAA
jgi:ATP/maltotriose-dependent transcriptional regulator MalT